MSNDDTFFGSSGGSDHTVLKPTPGRRSRGPSRPPTGGPPPVSTGMLPRTDTSDTNALAAAAMPLLSLAGRLSNTASHSDPASLFRHIVQEMQAFEAAARNAGVPPEAVMTARYALCTLLDEVVLNTPWGGQSSWAGQTLLSTFHKEGWGGEKCFQVLDRLLQQPVGNLDLLELMYLCLAMGLQGQYRVREDGRSQLDGIRNNVYQTLRSHRGQLENELSPHWKGVEDKRSPLTRSVPIWVVGAVATGVVLAMYLGFSWNLNRASDPVAVEIAGLGRNIPPLVERRGFVQTRSLTLADLLQSEIQSGALEVTDRDGVEVVTLRAMFASGSGEVSPQGQSLLAKIATALNQLPGQVLITGHTDDKPIRTLRFPSNWHLSKRRAEAVAEIIAATVVPSRLVAEPRADSDPLVANTSPQNRAINRRVEIALFGVPGRE